MFMLFLKFSDAILAKRRGFTKLKENMGLVGLQSQHLKFDALELFFRMWRRGDERAAKFRLWVRVGAG